MVPKKDDETGVYLSTLPVTLHDSFKTLSDHKPSSEDVTKGSKEVDDRLKIRNRLWKNCAVLTLSWLCLYMGYNSINTVQSSLNSDKGLGVAALCVEFATMAFGNLFTDSVIIKRLGCKWSVVLGMAVYSVYMAANFYPAFYTLVPLAAVSGITSAAMWVAQSTYITRLGQEYADHMGVNSDKAKSRFMGILYMGYLASNVLGNIVSSLIFGSNLIYSGGPIIDVNAYNPFLNICGAVYCNEDLGTSFRPGEKNPSPPFSSNTSSVYDLNRISRRPDDSQVYAFCGFCVSAGIFAAAMTSLLLDSLPSLGIDEDEALSGQSTKKLLTAAVRQWKDVNQLMLIPIGIYNGMDNPFWTSEFSKAFVTCAIGTYFIGFVMACYGTSSPITSFVAGFFGMGRFRLVPFIVAYLAHFCTAISLLYWRPSPGNVVEMFIITAFWGVGTGVWSGQVPAFYSVIFKDNLEAAFSNSRLWDAVGRSVSYGWSFPLCVKYKIYLVTSMVTLGMVGLFAIEIRQMMINRKNKEGVDNQTSDVYETPVQSTASSVTELSTRSPTS